MYPCVALATAVDTLRLALDASADGPASVARVEAAAEKVIKTQLRATGRWPTATRGREDERWYWAALALLDAPYGEGIANWCKRSDGWSDESTDAEDKHSGGFRWHVEEFRKAFDPGFELGRAPRDLVSVLAEIALASPAVCALRALRRVCGVSDWTDFSLLDAAAKTAEGIRSLLNLPETMALLRAEDDGLPYWRRVLRHGIEGNLQATLDEYFHCLRESLGVVEHEPAEAARQIAAAAAAALSIRTSHLDVDEIRVGRNGVHVRNFGIRCRFALRYGELREERESALTRAETVRKAFNSPFRPFLLATTSIGQEGLDFHTYCHRVYHWNLPSNPVDLEQREGRVQRYKGHAVRRNVATALGLRGLRGTWKGGDPWEQLFDLAGGHGFADGSDLVPYWIYEVEGGVRVERRVPMLPFSREEARLRRLKRGLAIYRLAFGQPRQEDLLAYLDTVADGDQVSALLEECRIHLGPR